MSAQFDPGTICQCFETFYSKWKQKGNFMGILQLEKYHWIIWLILDQLWMEQRRPLIRLRSGFGFFGFQIQWILFQKGFIRSKIRFWIHRKNTPKVVTRLKLFSQKGRPGLKCFLLHRSWQKQPELLETDFQTESNLGNMLLAFLRYCANR